MAVLTATISTDGFGNQTTVFAVPAASYTATVYQVTWSLTGVGSSGHITVLGASGPTRSGPGTWTETLASLLVTTNDAAGLTVAWSVIYSGSGTPNVTASTLTTTLGVNTFAKYWSWDALGENLCMAWVDVNASLKASSFRSASAKLSGRTMPAWDAATVLETYCGDVNLGYFPLGSVYMCYVPQNSSGINQPNVFRINNALGAASAWSSSTAITYNIGGPFAGNSGPLPQSQNDGDGADYFVHSGQTLFYFSNYVGYVGSLGFGGLIQQSVQTDGTFWEAGNSGATFGGQGTDGLRYPQYDLNVPHLLLAYEQFQLLNGVVPQNAQAFAIPPEVQPSMVSKPVWMADGTLVQLAYCKDYYKWRAVTPGVAVQGFDGVNNTVTLSMVAAVPATGTIVDVTLAKPFVTKYRWIAGTLDTNNKPVRVTFAIPVVGAAAISSLVPQIGLDISFVNAKNLIVTVGTATRFPNTLAPQNVFNGSGRSTYTPDHVYQINQWHANTGNYFIYNLSGADCTTVRGVAAGGGNVTLPISYSGTADSITINGVTMDLAYPCDAMTGETDSFLWTYGSQTYSSGPPFAQQIGPCSDAGFIAALQAAAGGNVTTSFATTCTCVGGSLAPWRHVDIFHTSLLYHYQDAVQYFRLMRSRDGGCHWEFAADGAPISGLDTLRQFENLTGQVALMPMLATNGIHLYIGWVQNSAPQLLVSPDCGETWV